MATTVDVSRTATPFISTLYHLARVQVAVPLFNGFDMKTLDKAFRNIQIGNPSTSKEGREGKRENNYNRAEEDLLFIPGHLRKSVLEAVHGMHCSAKSWQMYHRSVLKSKSLKFIWYRKPDGKIDKARTFFSYADILKFIDGEYFFHWRSDGTIDTVKTAEHLALNENIDIIERFELACMYCLEKSVQTLWTEMEASGQTENIEISDNCMERFWVRWLREGSRVPWMQAIRENLDPPIIRNSRATFPIFRAFFPFLEPEDRQKFVPYLGISTDDDLRFCLYTVNKQEEAQILKNDALIVLCLHLEWPLQTLFLETTEKLWSFINVESFQRLLIQILDYSEGKKDFDYRELLVEILNRSPKHLSASLIESPELKMRINAFVSGNRKRKADGYESKNKKK